MSTKRALHQDPEYEAIPAELQEKRIKLMEDSVRKQTKKKIENIVKANFDQEKNSKDAELDALDEALYECRSTLDRLRACAVTHYYANLGSEQAPVENSRPSVHPTVKKYLGKTPRYVSSDSFLNESSMDTTDESSTAVSFKISSDTPSTSQDINKKVPTNSIYMSPSKDISSRAPRFKTKTKIVIGNISKFIPVWQRDESDQSTHKWMIYVRGGRNSPNIEGFVSKVRFLLHPSYRPTDIVEICNPPFHLVKRGWGEFPVRVQLHFHDVRNKPVDIIHNLKLDKTYTGLQTLGAETVVELQLFKSDTNGSVPVTPSSSVSSLPSTSNNGGRRESTNESNFNSFPISIPIEFDSETNIESPSVLLPTTTIPDIDKNKTNDESTTNEESRNGILNKKSLDAINGIITPKKDVPPSVNSASESKTLTPKPNTTLNGVKTTYLKCTDNEGRLLLVPQSSFLQIKSGAKTNLTNSVNSEDVNKKTPVPSYILKVVPNQESGQNQVLLIPMSGKKSTEIKAKNISSDVQKTNNLVTDKNHVIDVPFKKPKCDRWQEEVSNIKLENYKSFVELLKRVCRVFSLVKEGVDRSTYPFCANSLEEYLRWNIGKQRAAEWRRAGTVRTAILNFLRRHNISYLAADNVWPRHRIMSWCRRNGFVPMTSEKMTLLPESKWSGVELCSVSNADDLLSTLDEEDNPQLNSSIDNEEIEIVEDVCVKSTTVKKSNQNQPSSTHLPPLVPASVFVKETASQIGIDIKPVELEPSLYGPAIEDMILAACRELATDLIQSSVNAGYNRVGGQFCPEEITVSDVYSAIKDNSKFDFLSNSHLGVPKEARDGT